MKTYSFSAKEKLKSRKEIKKIFSSGTVIVSKERLLKAIFVKETKNLIIEVKIVPAVSKKLGCAVWRNRVKRIIRESYRLNKIILIDACLQKKQSINIIFSPQKINEKTNKNIRLSKILPSMIELINRITKEI